MFLSKLRIENFRIFGEKTQALTLEFKQGLTALVGENDTGKTAVIDALRFALSTRDQEYIRLEDSDFHQPSGGGKRRDEIRIRCKFEELTDADKGAFVEHLTYENREGAIVPVLCVNWKAVASPQKAKQRRFISVEVRSGQKTDGPQFDQAARECLAATYLRPMRDAERAMSSGRGSRLSQILRHANEIRDHGTHYDPEAGPPEDLGTLSLLGIGDLTDALVNEHKGVQGARESLNKKYLQPLSFSSSPLHGHISVNSAKGDSDIRLRALLEKLDLDLRDVGAPDSPSNRGLGSNNILFMACELLLLGSEEDGHPLLLVEEPEAHLHPQRQLRLMQFLKEKAGEQRADSQKIQIILTTHSPNLASAIDLDNMILLRGAKAFSLASGCTKLDKSDYGFLTRFLDVTKANLFFARGLIIVEGDAESILIPTLAQLLGRDLTASGVSVVNVGGTGLRRFARIYLRSDPERDGMIDIPVACITDFDIMPDCAPEIVGLWRTGEPWPGKRSRRWRAKRDFTPDELTRKREEIRAKASGQRVESFVADEWTLEYDLAFAGLAAEVWLAAQLARFDERIHAGKMKKEAVAGRAAKAFEALSTLSPEECASHVYAVFAKNAKVSKATAAQYLADILKNRRDAGQLPSEALRGMLPKYLVAAIDYATALPHAEAQVDG